MSTNTSAAESIPVSKMSDAGTSSLAVTEVSDITSMTVRPTKVKGLESAILRSYTDIIHPLHEHAGIVHNLRLPWLTHYRTFGEEYQDCVDHSAELAYAELAFLNYLIDTDLSEESDVQVRSFIRDMKDEIEKFISKLNKLQTSLNKLWSTMPPTEDDEDPIQSAMAQLKAHISKFPSEKQKIAEGVEIAIHCHPDFAMTVEKILLHWEDHRLHFATRLRATHAVLSSVFISDDRAQRVSTQDYITAIHTTMKEHSMYFAKTNQFVKTLSCRAVSKLQKEALPLPAFCKTAFMETIGAPIFAHAARELKHRSKLLEAKILAELVSVKYLSEGKYRIGVAVDVTPDVLSQQARGDIECRCKSLQVVLRFDHANHRGGSQLFRPQVVDCQPRTGKLNSEDIKSTLTSRTSGHVPVLKFIESYRDKKEEYTTRHGIDVINSKHDIDDSGVASGATWVIKEDTFREFKNEGIPGIPLSVDIRTDDSHQVLVSVEIKAVFALRVKLLPWVWIPASREITVHKKDRFVNLAVWSIKECNSEAQKEEGSLKLDVVKDSVQYSPPS